MKGNHPVGYFFFFAVPGDGSQKLELGARGGLDFCKMEILRCPALKHVRRRRQVRKQAGRYPGNLLTIASSIALPSRSRSLASGQGNLPGAEGETYRTRKL